MSVSVLGTSVISCHGVGVSSLFDKIESGEMRPRKTYNYNNFSLELDDYSLPDFELSVPVSKAVARRLGSFSKICFEAILQAMQDAEFEIENGARVGIVIGTAYGPSEINNQMFSKYAKYGSAGASPVLFSNSVHNTAASFISQSLGVTGPVTTIVNNELSLADAIQTAENWIDLGHVDAVLLAVGDELSTTHIDALCVNSKSKKIFHNPYAKETVSPGGGVGAFVLSRGGESDINLVARIGCKTEELPQEIVFDLKGDRSTYDLSRKLFQSHRILNYSNGYGYFLTSGALDLALAIEGARRKRYCKNGFQEISDKWENAVDEMEFKNEISLVQLTPFSQISEIQVTS